jgi:hypothetical protein
MTGTVRDNILFSTSSIHYHESESSELTDKSLSVHCGVAQFKYRAGFTVCRVRFPGTVA